MSSLTKSLQPSQNETVPDEKGVAETYKYWRVRILYSIFIGYAFYYFTRRSYTFAMPGLIEDLHFDKPELGLLATIFSITYAISKFTSGVISDRVYASYFMAFGLIMTGILNIAFGFSSTLIMFSIFWGLNGWFQAFGAPPCSRFLTQWYSQSERGSWWSTWSASHNTGSFIIPWIAATCLVYLGWRYAMFIPGVISILGGVFLINRLRDTPSEIGLPPIEQFRNDYTGVARSDSGNVRKFTTKEILSNVFSNRYLWMLGIAYTFVYLIRYGVGDWTALYLIEAKGYSRIGASGCASLFEVGGFFGSLSAGWISDKLFNAYRGPVNFLYAIGMLIGAYLFWLIPNGYPILDSCLMFFLGFMVFGPQMLIGVVACELSPKQVASTATGFVGCFAYMGAAIAGYPLGKITQTWGWDGYFISLLAGSTIAIILLMPLLKVKENLRKPVQLTPKQETLAAADS